MDAIEILDKFGIQLEGQRLRKGGQELTALCPFHEDTRASFSLNVQEGIYNCFSCGAKGRIWDIIAACTNLTSDEARRACSNHLPIETYIQKSQVKKKNPPPRIAIDTSQSQR